MRGTLLHLSLCSAVALVPLVLPVRAATDGSASVADAAFPGWPETFAGRSLSRLPAHPDDARFVAEGGGARIARFTDGEDVVLVRWSPAPTRHLHPSSACFRAVGWTVTPAARVTDARGRSWTAYAIERDGVSRHVRERVEDATGRSWPDPTDWYWAGLLGRAGGPAFAFTVVERERWR